MINNNNLIWLDLEMTGLDTFNDHIIEIATIVTDAQLNIIAEGPVLAIHVNDDILNGMDDWNTRQHTSSGLVRRVKESQITALDAEAQTIDFLSRFIEPGCSPMCGNSICQDRRFMAREMPKLETFFHYRNLDVSTIKELTTRWAPNIAAGVKKDSAHLALSDIHDSINELKYYREKVFKI